ncbi:NAD(P)H-dependent oxidoreductase subunit E [Mariprofundus ferrooxydans]|nr:NAD(P)H-dependent oxidoreductase subunit E [Mariprofundus ferrooxydans]
MSPRPSEHLLHLLHTHQRQRHFISDQAIIDIASQLKLPRAQIEAVTEFYSFFSRKPRGKFDILFSNCTSCGDLTLMQELCDKLSIKACETRCDGQVSLTDISCIGMCDHGASALVNDRPLHSLDSKRITQMAALIEADTPLDAWPAEWFEIDDHVQRTDLLLSTPFEAGSALQILAQESIDATLEKIRYADLRGRGGAGFSTAKKWKFCRESEGETRYVICNADEGEPGTFKDRLLLTRHADSVFEGMVICARIINAKQGYIYLRGEYRYLLDSLETALSARRKAGLLGNAIVGLEGFDFDIAIVLGAGAYICGEESALIESLEEKPGIPRIRPPFPVTSGYLGKPTVVNNVETLAAAAAIVLHGGHWFRGAGTWQSRGSKILSISGDCARPGIYEYPFGVTIHDILNDCGAEHTQAVQVGGPSGRLVDASHFEHRIAFEDLATGGSLMIFDDSRDLLQVIRNFTHFFAHESCGFCTPCRVGTMLLKNGMDKVCSGHATAHDLDELKSTAALVSRRSHCGLGITAPNPIRDGLKNFPQLFEQRLLHQKMEPEFDLDAALEEARQIAQRDDAEAHL